MTARLLLALTICLCCPGAGAIARDMAGAHKGELWRTWWNR